MEFGSRRAQSYDAAIYGARAAYIGGVSSTACVILDRDFDVPSVGTMAHSWVQIFDTEYEAFESYARLYPDSCTLLVDTYNTVKSGVPNAIRAFNEVLSPMGKRPKGIRIDSGDIAYLSKKARAMLDEAGYPDCKIIASNSLDEYIIRDLLIQGARIDSFGVGEKLITSNAEPVMGGVYKLAAIQDGEGYIPKIKISETVEKITTPGFKSAYRFVNRESGKAIADYITVYSEEIKPEEPVVLFDPDAVWKKKTVQGFGMVKLLTPIFAGGKRVYELPRLADIQRFCAQQVDCMWDEVKRFENPHRYYVDLSQKLWNMKQELLVRQ
jgi:nicotinate phosphoribosyltransferase